MTTRPPWEPPDRVKKAIRTWQGVPWHRLPDSAQVLLDSGTHYMSQGDIDKLCWDLVDLGLHPTAVMDLLTLTTSGYPRKYLRTLVRRAVYHNKKKREHHKEEPVRVLTMEQRFSNMLADTFGNEPFEATPAQLAALCNLTEKTVRQYLWHSRRAGLIQTIRTGTAKTPAVYQVLQPVIPLGTPALPSLKKRWKEILKNQSRSQSRSEYTPSRKASELYVDLCRLFGVMVWFSATYSDLEELGRQYQIHKYSVVTLRKLLRELDEKGYLWRRTPERNKPTQYYLYDL